ncbi:hypothetical protein PGB28_19895 [Primorskyibacter aestuariivivens]|uniref:hypothetical protein n=1 Tax=Primorskyibacter aestuariivivens TaxID=1888912 RepID=UPI0023005C11|nr:hypothetical protein [Primorskyibacter aestuariivivens]MDA7430731.1 hypothetical protein [Primorskyibacter aestuariivivens]
MDNGLLLVSLLRQHGNSAPQPRLRPLRTQRWSLRIRLAGFDWMFQVTSHA